MTISLPARMASRPRAELKTQQSRRQGESWQGLRKMPNCEKCGRPSLVLFNTAGKMLCPLCEATTAKESREELRELMHMSEAQFSAWLEEDRKVDTQTS